MTPNLPQILLVEDEKNVGSTLAEQLAKEGFQLSWCQTKEEACLHLDQKKYDLALLDVGLPDGSGFEVAKILRQKHPSTALIFLTAFGSPEDRVKGLELGAEDYIVKPFHLKELILRIRNGLKRAKYVSSSFIGQQSVMKVGKALVKFDRFEAEVDGKTYPLTHKEAAVLKLLLEKKGQVVSRDEILNHAWSEDEFPTPRTVDNFIVRIRRLVEVNPESSEIIRSVRGVGYLLL